MKEREINLIDLLAEILLHWRTILLCMLIGGVLMGLVPRKEKGIDLDFSLPENNFSEQEIQNVNRAIAYEKAYRGAEDYLEKSTLMKMDPNQVGRADAVIVVEAEDGQKSHDIEKVYEGIVQSSGLMERVAEDVGIEMAGIEEMICLAGKTPEISNNINEDNDKNTFWIIAKHADESGAKKMLASAVAFLKEKQPDIESVFGKHKITVVSESSAVVADKKVVEIQKNLLYNAEAMKTLLSEVEKALSDTEQKYYAFLTNKGGVAETASKPVVNVKYVFVGAGLAAFLYAFFIFLTYIFDTKIRAADSLQELYGIPQFGMIPAPAGNKDRKPFAFIDRWILSFRDRNRRRFTEEEALELASAAVKISAGKEGLQEIYLIGCGLKERSLEMGGKIKEYLEKEGIRVKMLNHVLYDAQAMEELEYAKGAVLAECVGVTLYSEIEKELELLHRQGITALGGILLE